VPRVQPRIRPAVVVACSRSTRDLIGTLWDSLLDEGVEPPVSDEQRTELRRRLAEHRDDPDAVMTWDDAKPGLGRRE